MNTSFGEQDIAWNSQIIGRVRVIDLVAAPALYPRLALGVGCTLREHRPTEERRVTPTGTYHLVDLIGELCLRDGGPVITEVRWLDRERQVRAVPFEDESQITLTGDLDLPRLERLESERKGQAPVLWLKLHPVLIGEQGLMPARIHVLRLQIPQDRWLQFLEGCDFGSYEVVELAIPRVESERFRLAAKELHGAISQLRAGEYESAALACRKALDAVRAELEDDRHWARLKKLLRPRVGEIRAAAYVELIKQLKQLGNPAAHAAPHPYQRDEAQLIVRLTSSLLMLVARAVEVNPTVESIPAVESTDTV